MNELGSSYVLQPEGYRKSFFLFLIVSYHEQIITQWKTFETVNCAGYSIELVEIQQSLFGFAHLIIYTGDQRAWTKTVFSYIGRSDLDKR